MKHQYGEIAFNAMLRAADIESRELFIIRRGDHQVLEICKAILRGPRQLCAGVRREVGGVDESSEAPLVLARGCEHPSGNILLLDIECRAQESGDALPHDKYNFIWYLAM